MHASAAADEVRRNTVEPIYRVWSVPNMGQENMASNAASVCVLALHPTFPTCGAPLSLADRSWRSRGCTVVMKKGSVRRLLLFEAAVRMVVSDGRGAALIIVQGI